MIKKIYASVRHWLLRFITLQLFVTLMSLPLLVAWGLPISLLSPLGNSIFNPLLTGFLVISTIIFITELLFIPNGLLCKLLDLITQLFVATSSYADSSWLIGVRSLPLPLLFALPLLALWIIITPLLRKPGARAGVLALVLIVVWAGARLTDHPHLEVLKPGRGNAGIALAYDTHSVAVFDYGTINPSYKYRTWWEYTLMPQLTKTTGRTTIDYLVCLKPSRQLLEGLETVHTLSPVKQILLVQSPSLYAEWYPAFKKATQTLKALGVTCTVIQAKSAHHQLTKIIGYTFASTSSRTNATEKKSPLITTNITCAQSTCSLGPTAR